MLKRIALLAHGCTAVAAAASAGPITVDDTSGRDNFAANIASVMAQYQSESARSREAASGTSAMSEQWYNPISEGSDSLWGTAERSRAETQWAKANLRLYDLYLALGGNPLDLRQVFRHEDGNYYVGLDTVGGQWFSSQDEAHGYFLKLLIDRSTELPQSVKDAVDALPGNALADVLAAAQTAAAASQVFLPRGQQIAATLTGSFGSITGTPVIDAPVGVQVVSATLVSAERIEVELYIAPAAALGSSALRLFAPNSSFVPVDRFAVAIAAGSANAPAPTDREGGSIATAASGLAVGGTVTGRIDDATDEDVFAVVVAEAGNLRIASSGSADLVGRIEDAAGQVLASNDDGGSWYNFVATAPVAAGQTYYVRVRHCCGGYGLYALSATRTAGSGS